MSPRTRRAAAGFVIGLALALLLGAAAVWTLARGSAAEAGDPYGPPPDVPLAADKSLGVNADLHAYDAGGREEAPALMQAAGFRWLRQRFSWDAIEPEQGAYDWAAWDAIVAGATRHNLKLIAVLDGAPAWAQADEDRGNPLAPPLEARDFGAFVAAFAARYRGQIDGYQIWDEPNIAPHWGAREVDPAAYARLLREGAIQVRAADPGATVLLAALAPNVEPGGANMSDLRFLDALYQWGATEWFDVVAAQPYDFGQPLDALPEPDRLTWSRVALLRKVMVDHGDEETAVWAVSFGLADLTEDALVQAENLARRWPWLGPMLWAAWSPGDRHGEYALVDGAGQPTLDLTGFVSLADAPAIAWPGVYPADHPSGRYEEDWRVTPSGADIGSSGARLIIPFRGTRLDLAVRRGDYRAFLFVTVDGQAANALPRDADGQAYVVLYDPLRQQATVTLARGLSDGDHVAEIVADRGWGQWAITGWTVSREVPARMPWASLALGLGSALVLAVTCYTTWPERYELLSSGVGLVGRYRALDDRLALALVAGAALLLSITVGTIPSLLALGLLSLLLLLRPEMGLPLIALTLPFYQVGKPLLGKVFSMVEILTLLAAAGWFVQWVLGKWGGGPARDREPSSHPTLRAPHWTALDWGVMALVVVGALSLLWSQHLREAAREYRTVVLEAAVFYGLLRAMVRDRRAVWRVADAWVLGGAAIAVVGIYQWAFGQNLITADGVWRVRGFYGSPNNLALYLGRVFPLVVAIAVWSRPGRGRNWRRGLYALAAGLTAVAILLTYSRGAWLVGVPAALLFLAAMRGRRVLAFTAGLLLVVAAALVLVVGPARLISLLDTSQGTTFFRLQLWQSSWAMIRDHPLLGVGLDNFLYLYRSHYVLPTAWEEFNLSHPHNLVLDFWLRLGLMGLVVLGWLLVAFFWQGLRLYRRLPAGRTPHSTGRLLVLGLMAGMVDFVAHGLVDNAFFLVDLAFVFMLMLALVQAVDAQARSTGPALADSTNLPTTGTR